MQKNDLQSLYNVIKAATDVAEEIAEILEDKKITWGEALGLVSQTGNIQLIISQGRQAVNAYLTGTNEQREEALAFLAEEFELPNQLVDAKLDATITYLGQLETALRQSVHAVIGIKNIWQKTDGAL